MKRILGLDLGTNSIGWAVTKSNFDEKQGEIQGIGSRIIPMSQDILGKFDSGQSISQTAERTGYRGVRRLYQRDNLRRERLHRILNILGFLPEHYKTDIDFERRKGQFKVGKESKLNYRPLGEKEYEFIFKDAFIEMVSDFKLHQPELFRIKQNGEETKIPYDWTIYYLRKKALQKKLSKEELAWILLNFNQKRGYYQLRGEEEETPDNKQKTFEVLEVRNVVETNDTIKKTGEKLFDIYFVNGWKYDKQTTKPENWLGKTKEFIVTASVTKAGEEKRTYKAVDSEKDWIAIKEKAQQDVDRFNEKNKTVGVANYIYDTLLKKPNQKIRGRLIKTIERKYYRSELEQILKTQIKLQPELFSNELYNVCINELYPNNEAHRNNIKEKGFKYLFIEDIIFYQRPLKSKKSTISGCAFEYRIYTRKNNETEKLETVKEPLKAISKSHPLYQEFRLWQFLKNLKIHKKEDNSTGKLELNVDVTNMLLPTEEAWVELFDYLNNRKEVEQKNVLEFLKIPKGQREEYRWNYVEDKKYPANETRAQFLSRLKKVENGDGLSEEKLTSLWHIVYSVKDKEQYKTALATFAKKNNLDQSTFVHAFEKFPPFKNDYGSYSEKALKKILPLMRMGKYWDYEKIDTSTKDRIQKIIDAEYDEKIRDRVREKAIDLTNPDMFKGLPTWLASYIVYDRHSEVAEITQWKTTDDIDTYLKSFKQHSLRNPIVEQVITETLRTVRDIWKEYGNFDEIHVELGREMKNPADKRKRMTERNSENENTNNRVKELLKELMNDGVEQVRPHSPNQQEILKIYEEGVFNNPDTRYTDLNEDDVERIRKNASPSSNDIKRYKLWLEQGYVSPYTGATISLTDLFSEKYQIEHVIPQSRLFDDALTNKVICESEVNEIKSNQTAYEFIKNNEGRLIELQQGRSVELFTLDRYEAHCNRYFKKNRTKLRKLLSEEIPEGFIERQMNDSRYISKVVKGLLSNIVREDGEQEATSKHLVSVTGAITSKLKQDWGLNDKWNEIILPRFKRLNQIKNRTDFTTINSNGVVIPNVPDDIGKVEKKRIDHRHHALDALIIACTTKDHINYITSINTQRKNYSLVSKLRELEERQRKNKQTGESETFKVATNYKKPWASFTTDAKHALDTTVISFKQNLRVINRTNNKTWQWVKQKDGKQKKQLVAQKGKNFAIRKPMHKETVAGKVKIQNIKFATINIAIDDNMVFVDKNLNRKINKLRKNGLDNKQIKKYFKDRKYKFNDKDVKKVQVYYYVEATATRTELTDKFTPKQLEKITDSGIKKILENHIQNYTDENGKPDFSLAFNIDGIEVLNKNILALNNGKPHKPIYKVRLYEEGNKFAISEKEQSAKNKKYVEAAKGTNLFFAIYWNAEKQKREYDTIPLNEVIEHQKQQANLPKQQRTPIAIKPEKGQFLFSLSPNDLVYVPTDEEQENKHLVDFEKLTTEQQSRIYKMVSTTQNKLECVPHYYAKDIINNEMGTNNKSQNTIDGKFQIKDRCWKLKISRTGKIEHVWK